mmetsp:Transcript_15465/g.25750  ORF Transcript_15465/g.25750 Transcript_15465/m.25750 type:complete len:208 (-) Transcript_15465:296-919(-)
MKLRGHVQQHWLCKAELWGPRALLGICLTHLVKPCHESFLAQHIRLTHHVQHLVVAGLEQHRRGGRVDRVLRKDRHVLLDLGQLALVKLVEEDLVVGLRAVVVIPPIVQEVATPRAVLHDEAPRVGHAGLRVSLRGDDDVTLAVFGNNFANIKLLVEHNEVGVHPHHVVDGVQPATSCIYSLSQDLHAIPPGIAGFVVRTSGFIQHI